MSEDMTSWRSLANSAVRSVKSYVAQRDPRKPVPTINGAGNQYGAEGYQKQSWGQWAGQKIRSLNPGDEATTSGIERLALFPGWASRHYREAGNISEGAPFDIELFSSGFASKLSGPGFNTRSGRAFLRLAKHYAALSKLAGHPDYAESSSLDGPDDQCTKSIEEAQLHLPPRPDEITEESELRELEAGFERAKLESSDALESNYASSVTSSSRSDSPNGSNTLSDAVSTMLQKWNSNLEARLHPFWSTALGGRTVRISVYSSDPSRFNLGPSPLLGDGSYEEFTSQYRPVAQTIITTSPDGAFQARFTLRWEDITVHPGALHIAFGDPSSEQELFVVAELLRPPSRPSTPNGYPTPYLTTQALPPTVTTSVPTPLTHTRIRVISDIDDTVKLSGILQGARTVFRNVFVKDLDESIIPGMGDWYTSMWKRGVRFHYVSNGPFELLPVVSEFLQLSHLPPGSIRLKSYAGRSLFNGIMSAPAERKRAGIADVLDSFPDSRFFLVGDSGEQDLELYASFAKERPKQILAIFIRDANDEKVKPLDDPTGEEALSKSSGQGFGINTSVPPSIAMPSPVAAPSPASSRSSGTESSGLRYAIRKPTRSKSEAPLIDLAPSPPRSPRLGRPRPTRTKSAELSPPLSTSFPTHSIPEEYHTPHDPFLSHQPKVFVDEPLPIAAPSISASSSLTANSTDYPPSTWSRPPAIRRTPSRSSSLMSAIAGQPQMTEAERKQLELQIRVHRAKLEIPLHIPLRIFRNPEDCVEAMKFLDSMNFGKNPTS